MDLRSSRETGLWPNSILDSGLECFTDRRSGIGFCTARVGEDVGISFLGEIEVEASLKVSVWMLRRCAEPGGSPLSSAALEGRIAGKDGVEGSDGGWGMQ